MSEKQTVKRQLTDALDAKFERASRSDIEERVDDRYEELLDGATVTQHIPVLTAGDVREDLLRQDQAATADDD